MGWSAPKGEARKGQGDQSKRTRLGAYIPLSSSGENLWRHSAIFYFSRPLRFKRAVQNPSCLFTLQERHPSGKQKSNTGILCIFQKAVRPLSFRGGHFLCRVKRTAGADLKNGNFTTFPKTFPSVLRAKSCSSLLEKQMQFAVEANVMLVSSSNSTW